jgi:hypothetical protein
LRLQIYSGCRIDIGMSNATTHAPFRFGHVTILEAGNEMTLTQAQAKHLVGIGLIYACEDETCACAGNFYHVCNDVAGYPDNSGDEQKMWGRIAMALPASMV